MTAPPISARSHRLNLRVKPHLRRWGRTWECMGIHGTCLGATMEQAYGRLMMLEREVKIRLRDDLQRAIGRARPLTGGGT
jgi:hypothetical protein